MGLLYIVSRASYKRHRLSTIPPPSSTMPADTLLPWKYYHFFLTLMEWYAFSFFILADFLICVGSPSNRMMRKQNQWRTTTTSQASPCQGRTRGQFCFPRAPMEDWGDGDWLSTYHLHKHFLFSGKGKTFSSLISWEWTWRSPYQGHFHLTLQFR